ncbi:MAG: iron-containing alcohol dehydrogenase [Mariprofundaceae bacterium]|nr:iron-containing alcohol dehydrogenase [Mariprofundaceae bacterium]
MREIQAFTMAATPHIHFGVGKRAALPALLASFGKKVLLITGGKSFDDSPLCQALWEILNAQLDIQHERVTGEPSAMMVDDWVQKHRDFCPDVVLAIGGGSAVDAAKAVAGLLPSGDSVMDYLEGVGKGKTFAGETTPLIAMPTTAGTGGETSKNAVLSLIGDAGYKKSFRHERLVAQHIILDPELTLSCSKATTAACGMDAFTQLLESYVSSKANPMTDALAWSGLQKVSASLLTAYDDGKNIQARADMLYASSLSGLTLANAGLGSVHGLASPLGAFYPIAHGVVCGTLLLEATRINITAMTQREPEHIALAKYADVGRLLVADDTLRQAEALAALLQSLEYWQSHLNMPKLADYGIKRADFEKIIANISGGSMATNPISLQESEIIELLQRRL